MAMPAVPYISTTQNIYPDSDGRPMADNTLQYQYIITIQVGLDALLPHDFVAGDLLWYPVQGRPDISIAPDVLVALGRPKGHRGSYKQWEEGFTAPQIAFEILSLSNTEKEMAGKRWFYEHYGVEGYCEYDPDRGITTSLGARWRRTDQTAFQPSMAQSAVGHHVEIGARRQPERLLPK